MTTTLWQCESCELVVSRSSTLPDGWIEVRSRTMTGIERRLFHSNECLINYMHIYAFGTAANDQRSE